MYPTRSLALPSARSSLDLLVEEVRRRLDPQNDAATPEWVPASAPQNEIELRDYLADTFGVRLPDQRCCPHHTTPFHVFATAYFAEHSVTVWEGSLLEQDALAQLLEEHSIGLLDVKRVLYTEWQAPDA